MPQISCIGLECLELFMYKHIRAYIKLVQADDSEKWTSIVSQKRTQLTKKCEKFKSVSESSPRKN
jgi:hypothetical protein